jgi:hypothetical protein
MTRVRTELYLLRASCEALLTTIAGNIVRASGPPLRMIQHSGIPWSFGSDATAVKPVLFVLALAHGLCIAPIGPVEGFLEGSRYARRAKRLPRARLDIPDGKTMRGCLC